MDCKKLAFLVLFLLKKKEQKIANHVKLELIKMVLSALLVKPVLFLLAKVKQSAWSVQMAILLKMKEINSASSVALAIFVLKTTLKKKCARSAPIQEKAFPNVLYAPKELSKTSKA